MRTTPRTPHVHAPMDSMRPSQILGATPRSDGDDARRWMRLVFMTMVGAAAILPLLGATTRALVDQPVRSERRRGAWRRRPARIIPSRRGVTTT
jgi:hypothetical protein